MPAGLLEDFCHVEINPAQGELQRCRPAKVADMIERRAGAERRRALRTEARQPNRPTQPKYKCNASDDRAWRAGERVCDPRFCRKHERAIICR
jgi:hypothetical protein